METLTPEFLISCQTEEGQQNITPLIKERLISLTLTDNRGLEVDTLELQISDHDNALNLLPRNASLLPFIGWKNKGIYQKGVFLVDELQWQGPPDVLTIRAKSADLKGSIHEKTDNYYDNLTLEELINQIATRHGLTALISENLKNQPIEHLDQTNESDLNFLSRLAEQYNALITIKNETLLFLNQGQGKTATGQELKPIEITKTQGDRYSFSLIEAENFQAVRTYWHNKDTGKQGEIIARKTATGQPTTEDSTNALLDTDAEQIKTIRYTYASKQYAQRIALSTLEKASQGAAQFSITLAHGRPELIPEQPVKLNGFKPEIDKQPWIIKNIIHEISDSGYINKIHLEKYLNEFNSDLTETE